MNSTSSTSSDASSKSHVALKRVPKTEGGLKADHRAAYNTGDGHKPSKPATDATHAPGSVAAVPAATSIKFADLPITVRHSRAAPRPITPYPPSMEAAAANEYKADNAALLCSPRPKKAFQPLAL